MRAALPARQRYRGSGRRTWPRLLCGLRIGKRSDQPCLGKAVLGKAEARRFIGKILGSKLCLSSSVRDLAGVPPAFATAGSCIRASEGAGRRGERRSRSYLCGNGSSVELRSFGAASSGKTPQPVQIKPLRVEIADIAPLPERTYCEPRTNRVRCSISRWRVSPTRQSLPPVCPASESPP